MIKKYTLIFGSLFLFACGVGSANAATFDSSGLDSAVTPNHNPTVLSGFKSSKQVTVAVNASTQSYAATADHVNGTRVFGTASGDPLIYYTEKATDDIGTTKAADELGTTAEDSSAFVGVAGWSSL